MNNKKYAVGMALYNPDFSTFERISMMASIGYSVYVFDNSPTSTKFKDLLLTEQSVKYITAGTNVGLGTALTILCATAFAQGFKALLFFDQDTSVSASTLGFIDDFQNSILESEYHTFASVTFNGSVSEKRGVSTNKLAINSGSLFNLSVLQEIGWHNKNYFVDCVDYEFCLRAQREGFKVGVVSNAPDFDHESEQPDRIVYFRNAKIALRRYSMSRIADAVGAYIKLIFRCLVGLELRNALFLIRSFIIYISLQLLSRILKV
jgi:rhamnosyltransferase